MGYDPDNITSQDWRNLTSKMQGIVHEAIEKLEGLIPVDPQKSEWWQNVLRKQSDLLDEISLGYQQGSFQESGAEGTGAFVVLKDQAEQLERELSSLVPINLDRAEPVFNALQSQVQSFVSAGPHGSGGGRPRPGSGVG
jgi:hypothetical protein